MLDLNFETVVCLRQKILDVLNVQKKKLLGTELISLLLILFSGLKNNVLASTILSF